MGRIKQCYCTLDKAQDAVQHISPFICWHCDRPVSDSIQHHEYKATDVEIREPPLHKDDERPRQRSSIKYSIICRKTWELEYKVEILGSGVEL